MGDPVPAIVDTARKHNTALIAMATHGRSGLPHLVLGTVAYGVVRDSQLPVLLIRPPLEGAER